MPQTDIFTVITTMKNEGPFLLEWVAHHKALGFDHLVICTNDCEDTTTEMVVRLQSSASCGRMRRAIAPASRSSAAHCGRP
ncbi:glycosyltransferase family 2 protein [Gemmobacter lanyuensis]